MKKSTSLLASIALLALSSPLTTNAATEPCVTPPTTQVYDLKADWSDTANPNGTWSLFSSLGGLMINTPFPWADPIYGADPFAPAIKRTTEAAVVPGYLEVGDVAVFGDVWVLWTAPASGTVNISGAIWSYVPDCIESGLCSEPSWTLTHNGSGLSEGSPSTGFRSSPDVLSSGSGGAAALQNIPVNGGDQVVLGLYGGWHFGVNFTITLTTEAAGDPNYDAIIWHQPLARSGSSEDTDPSAGRTVKYRFKRGSTIPIQIRAVGCDGSDVTSNANVIATVTVFGDSNCGEAADANAEPIAFNGAGGGGGVMDKIDGHLKYNLDTQSLPTTTQCYILRVTVMDTSTGEEKFEEVLLQAK